MNLCFLLCICVLLREKSEASNTSSIDDKINQYEGVEKTFELIQEGERYLYFGEYTDIVLMLGNTGAGKSTFTQFIAGDNSKMKAVEVEEGTGEYIIIDDNNKISQGVLSKTVIPERVVDPETDTAFFDCPGFSDTRNAAFDIASTYLIKKTIDHAKSVKIVLTVSYSSVRVGVDRIDFMKLLQHTTELIKDISKFTNSIILVVSKLDNDYIKKGRELVLVPDEKVINKIASYINKVKQTIQEIDITEENKEFNIKSLILIDIFLTKKNNKYSNIFLFRRPDTDGLISENELLQDGKKVIKDAIQEMVYVRKNAKDFGYSVSDKSKHSISKLFDKISSEFVLDVYNTTAQVKKFINKKMKETKDVYVLKEEINHIQEFILKYQPELEKSDNFKQFFIKYVNFINDLGVWIPRGTFLNMAKKYKYIEFLQLVANEKFAAKSIEWTHPLVEIINTSREVKAWYNFILDLYKKISNFKLYNKMSNTHLNSSDLKSTIRNLKTEFITDYETVEKMEIDSQAKSDFRKVLRAVYSNNMTTRCVKPDTLLVKGDFVHISKIVKLRFCPKLITTISIYALNTIFIDADLVRVGDEINLVMIASKWEVIGQRQINLDGAVGAAVSAGAGLGRDGSPGLPGGPAGNFFGIADQIISGDRLTVRAIGGTGGTGQDGGAGFPGADAVFEKPDTRDQKEGEDYLARFGFIRGPKRQRAIAGNFVEVISYAGAIGRQIHEYTYTCNGIKGQKGGEGGRPGAGGSGGQAGKVNIYTFEKNDVKTISKNGNIGKNGNPGEGGKGGRNIGEITIEHHAKHKYHFYKLLDIEAQEWTTPKFDYAGYAASGDKNTNPITSGRKQPRPISNFQLQSRDVTDYKTYLLENVNDPIKRHYYLTFYSYLSNDTLIKNLYDTCGLLNELQKFESKTEYFINDLELNNFYSSLMERIKEYASHPKKYETDKSYKKILNYLYAVTLSKAVSIKQNSTESALVIDIDGYFKMVFENLNMLRSHMSDVVKSEYNQKYKNSIETKITEANELIESQIITEIDVISRQLESNFDILSDEISMLKQQALAKKNELSTRREKLKRMLEKKLIFDIVKGAASIAQIAGPIGSLVGGIIETGTNMIESLVLEEDKSPVTTTVIPAGVTAEITRGITFFDDILKNKSLALKHILGEILTEVDTQPDCKYLENITKNIQKELEQAEENKDIAKINSLYQKLSSSLEIPLDINNGLQLNKARRKGRSADIKKKAEKHLERISKTLMVAQHSSEYLYVHSETYDDPKVQEITRAIAEQEDKIVKLTKYKEQIYDSVYPTLIKMEEGIKQYQAQAETQTKVALDVSGWQIRSTIKDVKSYLTQITQDFDIQEDVLYLIEKLENALVIQGTLYDKIQTYKEQKEFADYIADINSMNSAEIKTNNKTLDNALVQLELQVKSNIVMAQYKKAMDSIKQFVFPFAHYYLEEFELPNEMKQENNLESIIKSATTHMNKLRTKLQERKLLLFSNFDAHVYEEFFQSGENFNGPFYQWENEKYGTIISDLLSGKEIVIKADILHSIEEKNAIKFNSIRIEIKSKNQTIKDRLDKKLKIFDVYMTHSGYSYFRCDNIFYTLTSDKQIIYYSFEQDKKGEPVRKNRVFKKLNFGQYMLSPYTTWKIQLKKGNKVVFNDLDFAKGAVDLELAGHGQYIGAQNKVCSKNLKEYYKVAETISVTDSLDMI